MLSSVKLKNSTRYHLGLGFYGELPEGFEMAVMEKHARERKGKVGRGTS